jgi:hypothetical protein
VTHANTAPDVTTYRVGSVTLEIPDALLNDRMRRTFSGGGYDPAIGFLEEELSRAARWSVPTPNAGENTPPRA